MVTARIAGAPLRRLWRRCRTPPVESCLSAACLLVGWPVNGGGRGRGRGEFGADGVGVGVVEIVEDCQGLLVGVAGGGGVAGGAVGVAELREGDRFLVAHAKVAEQGEGLLVAGDGLGVLAEVVV